ncbi:MAG: coenzyme F420-0:L-glutamate ligase [Nitrososphaerota archaeon]|nr:coenzyme F420-0:L-glutamate ligase [Nitrososphaerota archaeon]
MKSIEVLPVTGLDEVKKGDDVGQLILTACKRSGLVLKTGDVIVVTHKIVSKSEGRVVDLASVTPSRFAIKASRELLKDPAQVEVILSESRRIVKMVRGLIISEGVNGFVCANAGVDQSNIDVGRVVLLPKRPDESASKIRSTISKGTRKTVAVIISDTFGRPWREGQVDVAIGISGIDPFDDYRGKKDQYGYNLKASVICTADEIASAAELCMRKLDRIPVAIVRGVAYKSANTRARAIARKPSRDLFR